MKYYLLEVFLDLGIRTTEDNLVSINESQIAGMFQTKDDAMTAWEEIYKVDGWTHYDLTEWEEK